MRTRIVITALTITAASSTACKSEPVVLKSTVRFVAAFHESPRLAALGEAAATSEAVSLDMDLFNSSGQFVAAPYLVGPSPAVLDKALAQVPKGPGTFAFERMKDGTYRTYLLDETRSMQVEKVLEGRVRTDEYTGRPNLTLSLTPENKTEFAELTKAIAGWKMAIVVDGEVVSAPIVMGEIPGGHVMISSGAGADGAKLFDRILGPRK